MNRLQARSCAALAALLLAACATNNAPETPLSEVTVESLRVSARTPHQFGLQVRPSPAGPVVTGGHRVHGARMDTLAFRGKGVPMIDVGPAGAPPFKALIDTSSPANWIAPDAGLKCGFRAFAGMRELLPAHVWDDAPCLDGNVPKLVAGKFHVENVLAGMRMSRGSLGRLARSAGPQTAQAVLGAPFLRAFSFVQIDYARKHVLLSSTVRFKSRPELLLAEVPLVAAGGAIACDGAIDGRAARFIIDTAGDFAVALHHPPGERAGRIAIGDLMITDVPVSSAYELQLGHMDAPRIGHTILSRYRVTLDFEGGRVVFERPSS